MSATITFQVTATEDFFRATAHVTERVRTDNLSVDEKRAVETSVVQAAEEVVAQFPKSAKVRAAGCSGSEYSDTDDTGDLSSFENHRGRVFYYNWVTGFVSVQIQLSANGVNHGINETGIKRYKSFRKVCDKLGYNLEFQTFGNSITEAELNTLIGA